MRPKNGGHSISGTGITFSPPSGYEDCPAITFQFADITELTLEDSIDFGECVEGVDTRNSVYGLWESDTLGSYYVSIDPDIDVYLSKGTVFNRI